MTPKQQPSIGYFLCPYDSSWRIKGNDPDHWPLTCKGESTNSGSKSAHNFDVCMENAFRALFEATEQLKLFV